MFIYMHYAGNVCQIKSVSKNQCMRKRYYIYKESVPVDVHNARYC